MAGCQPTEATEKRGRGDPLADVATQARLSDRVALSLEVTPENATPDDWGPVYGELLTFDNPSTRLPAIDRLEGFHPGGSSMYRRVMVAARVETAITPAWLYRMEYPPHGESVKGGRKVYQ